MDLFLEQIKNSDFYSLLFIILLSFVFTSYLISRKDKYAILIFVGFILRIGLMLADSYKWFPILNSGADTEGFHKIALRNLNNAEWAVKTNYTIFLTIIYYLTDASRLIAQYINVLFGLGVTLIVNRCLYILNVDDRTKNITMLVVVFLPNLIIFSGILLREAWVEFFVALSVLCFIKWFVNGNSINIVGVVVSILLASYMHSGVIGLLIGYLIAFIVYNPNSGSCNFSGNTIFRLVILTIASIGFFGYSEIFTEKFQKMESIDDITDITNKTRGGGSDYLQWINTNSIIQGLLFAPLKMFYFLFSPLPTEWRGLNDIIGFLIDGLVYMYFVYYIFKSKVIETIPKLLKRFLLTAFVVTTFIFAYGTTNAGTAFRHRAKLFPIIAVLYAISESYNDKNKKNG